MKRWNFRDRLGASDVWQSATTRLSDTAATISPWLLDQTKEIVVDFNPAVVSRQNQDHKKTKKPSASGLKSNKKEFKLELNLNDHHFSFQQISRNNSANWFIINQQLHVCVCVVTHPTSWVLPCCNSKLDTSPADLQFHISTTVVNTSRLQITAHFFFFF